MKSFFILTTACIALLLMTAACQNVPSVQCPTDQELIDWFNGHAKEFEQLANSPDDPDLLEKLRIEKVFRRSAEPVRIWFPVWIKDFFGPGSCHKGYAYYGIPPAEQFIVDSIDQNSEPGSPEEKELYRHISGGWYLYYSSAN